MKKCSVRKTKIGGQAVIEGVMMRGARSVALTVRDSNGNLRIDTTRLPAKKPWYSKVPFLRGVVNLVVTLVSGMAITAKSADVYAEDVTTEDKKKADKKNKKAKQKHNNVQQASAEHSSETDKAQANNKKSKDKDQQGLGGLMWISVLLGLVLAVALFILLPTYATTYIMKWTGIEDIRWARSLIEGGLKLLVFIGYLTFITLMKDIKRVFMYHGAEHKTIACYESGLPLTPENVKKCSRYHDRCGTSFIVFVLLLSIVLMFAVEAICYAVGFEQISVTWIRALIKIAMLPLTAAVSYEMLMLLAKTDFILFRPLKWLGKQFQKLTTREPDESMCLVAITSFNAVLEMDENADIPERHWLKSVNKAELQSYLASKLKEWNIDQQYAQYAVEDIAFRFPNSVRNDGTFKADAAAALLNNWDKLQQGMPYQYVVGVANFYGNKLLVNSDVLIPRQDTELVTEQAIKHTPSQGKVLDMCCGSGAIGITVALNTDAKVTLVDKYDSALAVARNNARRHKVDVDIVKSDMFDNVEGMYDLIVSNPPYIESDTIQQLDKSVKDYEPIAALDGGQDGLDFYRILATQAQSHLNAGATLVLEIGYNQGKAVREILSDNGWVDIVVAKDYGGNDRIVVAKCNN